ncbi:hypothetical protein FACS1894196_2490 [Clostridia bacterium]|nr:hypothetical protein FACS1894196_2490 [Clostridia bacterium]
MRRVRAAVVPLLLLVAIGALTLWDPRVNVIAQFTFIWDVLLGVLLGAGLALLPSMAGIGAHRTPVAGLFWVCGFFALLLIFYQYTVLVADLSPRVLAFLAKPGPRARVVEGVMLGYASVIAARGKL